MMKYRFAAQEDIPVLATMNLMLAEDEQHVNRFKTIDWFKDRMRTFLNGEYKAILFEKDNNIIGYALYTNHHDREDTIYLRQIFVDRDCRRQGIGKEIMNILLKEIWPKDKRITVEVLCHNKSAIEFYKSVGYKDYCMEMEISKQERNYY